MTQQILYAENGYGVLDGWFEEQQVKTVMLVIDEAFRFLNIRHYFEDLEKGQRIRVIRFSDFQPNPLYESVEEGVRIFHEEGCDGIIAVGGGSAMDVAKCIKLYSNMDPAENYLKQTIVPNQIPFLAVPTTAGTGSEATRYAVIYYEGAKQSVTDNSIIPETVLMDASCLKTLPLYQKKATMLDALMHATESYWSVNSTKESQEYSKEAIRQILAWKDGYLANQDEANQAMLKAAHTAGKAINITQTTAGHAMCYKLKSLYGIAHGHAAALCGTKLWPYMVGHTEKCADPRGEAYLQETFRELSALYGGTKAEEGPEIFGRLVQSLELSVPEASEADFEVLKTSVNPVRLKNNPVALDLIAIDAIYHEILNRKVD